MADYAIITEDIRDGFVTDASDTEISALIAVVSQADACMAGAGVADAVGQMLKTYAVRHILAMTANNGNGQVTQQSSASGASRSFKAFEGSRLSGTPYGAALAAMDTIGCVTAIFAARSGVAIMSVGGARS